MYKKADDIFQLKWHLCYSLQYIKVHCYLRIKEIEKKMENAGHIEIKEKLMKSQWNLIDICMKKKGIETKVTCFIKKNGWKKVLILIFFV